MKKIAVFVVFFFLLFFVNSVIADSEVTHEPQGGIYAGQSNMTKWAGGWVKYKANTSVSEGTEVGVGIMAGYTTGRSKINQYRWRETSIGPVVGIKKHWDDEESNPWMLEADISPQLYSIRGSNGSYWHHQSGWKINLRSEIKKQASEKWTVGGVVETNLIPGGGNFSSSWKGDKPSNRYSFEAGGYGIYQINDDWEYEAYAGAFYQGWDKLWGVKAIPAEFIYKKVLKFGVGASIFPFGLKGAYEGYSAKDLFTTWGFVQLDAGPVLRKVKEEENSKRVIPLSQPLSQKEAGTK